MSVLLCWLGRLWPIEESCKIAYVGWLKALEYKSPQWSALQERNWRKRGRNLLFRLFRTSWTEKRGAVLISEADVGSSAPSSDAEGPLMMRSLWVFKLLKQSKAYLSTILPTLGHCSCSFWSKNERFEHKLHSCCVFPSVFPQNPRIPGILLSFYQSQHNWLLGKHRKKMPVMNIGAIFSNLR